MPEKADPSKVKCNSQARSRCRKCGIVNGANPEMQPSVRRPGAVLLLFYSCFTVAGDCVWLYSVVDDASGVRTRHLLLNCEWTRVSTKRSNRKILQSDEELTRVAVVGAGMLLQSDNADAGMRRSLIVLRGSSSRAHCCNVLRKRKGPAPDTDLPRNAFSSRQHPSW